MANDFLDEKLTELRSRLKELEPLVDEHRRIQQALTALEGESSAPAKRGPGRPRGSGGRRSGSGGGGKRRRRRRGGTRAEQAAQLLASEPGLGVPEIADRLGIQPNYVYRVMNELTQDGSVRKEGKHYFPGTGAASDDGDASEPQPAAAGGDEA